MNILIDKILREGEQYPKSVSAQELEKKIKTLLPSNSKITMEIKAQDYVDKKEKRQQLVLDIPTKENSILNSFFESIHDLGWFPAAICLGSNKKNFKPFTNDFLNTIKETKVRSFSILLSKYYDESDYIRLDKNFDDVITPLKTRKVFYHITSLEAWKNSVSKNGLQPRSGSRRGAHPERIYLMYSELHSSNFPLEIWMLAVDFYNSEKDKNSGEYILIKIPTSSIKNIKLYADPDFNSGVYCYDAVPKSSLIPLLSFNVKTYADTKGRDQTKFSSFSAEFKAKN